MDASQHISSTEHNNGLEEDQEREQKTEEAPTREIEPGNNSKYHDCIKDENWDKLKKLLKKYKAKFYKKKRIEAKEKKEEMELFRLQQEEKEKENDEDGEEGTGKDELTGLNRLRHFRPFKTDPKKVHDDSRCVSVAKKVLPRYVSGKMFVDPADIVSPLLMADSDGRTPLQLACIHKAPEAMILELLEAEKKAAFIKDKTGQLPLHCAIQSWQYEHIIERIVKSNPNALKTKDDAGRTPIGLAVELAREGRDEIDTIEEDPDAPFLWLSPTSAKEKQWQFQQEAKWSKVNCLTKELINRRKLVIPSEHGLILEALEGGANPNTIIRMISTADRYLMMDDEFAGTAIGLCVERHYCSDTLEYLMENCREKTTILIAIVHKALKTHYLMGCYPLREGMAPFGKRVIDWAKKQEREKKREKKRKKKKIIKEKQKSVRFEDALNDSVEVEIDNKTRQWIGMKNSCKDWWEILNYLLFYCAYGRDYKTIVKPKTLHLLHAALAVPVTFPSLVHLLLIVYPNALKEKCPMYKVLPIHIACTRWSYDVINNDSECSTLDQVLNHMYELDPDQLYRRTEGSLPFHLALFGGQSWTFLQSMVSRHKKLVGMRDAQSKLFPFQIAALPIQFRNVQLLMRCQFTPIEWRDMSLIEKKTEYGRVADEHETRQVSTIFELLRKHPDAIEKRPLYKDSSAVSQKLKSLSKLSIHYLSWVYGRSSKGKYRVRYGNLAALRNSIVRAKILPELELWWQKLKECIWDESQDDIPKTTDYLMHAALHNSENPPLVTELLLQMFPSSTTKPIPGTSTFPLHICAGTMAYQPQHFEVPYGMNNLHLVLKAYKEATRIRSNGRLPLHTCLARGKDWKEVRPLIMVDLSSLKVEDPVTGLFPFELAASFKLTAKVNSLRYSAFIEKEMRTFDFHQLSTQEKALSLSKTRKRQELNQLTCIFELLRHKTSVLSMRCSEFMVSNDDSDDSVTSLFSFVDDHDGTENHWNRS